MKFLLTAVNAKYIHTNPALYSLKAYAKRYQEDTGRQEKSCVQIAEFTINNRFDEILSGIYKQSPDVIAFSLSLIHI